MTSNIYLSSSRWRLLLPAAFSLIAFRFLVILQIAGLGHGELSKKFIGQIQLQFVS